MAGLVASMCGARSREARLWLDLHLRLRTGVGVSILDVAVCMCVCGWVGLGSHDPGEGREGRMDKVGRMRTAMAAVACSIAHVKEMKKGWR